MPRLSQSVPRYRKHKASSQAIVEINGKRYYLGPHGSRTSKFEYDRLVAEWLSTGRSATFGIPAQQVSIVELIVAYLKYCRKIYGDHPRSEYRHVRRTLKPLRQLYGRLPAAEFGGPQLKAIRQKFVEAGHCRPYIGESVQRTVRMFRWAVGEGMIPADVPVALGMVKGLRRGEAPEGKKVRPVPPEVVAATLLHLSSVVRAMVELQQLTAMRPGEVVLVRPCDIDQSGSVWKFTPSHHKTEHHGKERVVCLGQKAQAMLRPYLSRPADSYCFSPAEALAEMRSARNALRRTRISCGNTVGSNRIRRKAKRSPRNRYDTQSYGRAIRRACDAAFPIPNEIAGDKAAVKKWRNSHRWAPNQLRHSRATEIRRRFGLESAKCVLGHASPAVSEIYAERDRRRAVKVAKKIG